MQISLEVYTWDVYWYQKKMYENACLHEALLLRSERILKVTLCANTLPWIIYVACVHMQEQLSFILLFSTFNS